MSAEREYKAGDPCPTGEHIGGRCCHACDHDFPVSCCCKDIADEETEWLAEQAREGSE